MNLWEMRPSNIDRFDFKHLIFIGCIVLILFPSNQVPTQALFVGHFSHGLENWEVWGENWTPAESGETVEAVDPYLEVEDGQLVSKGEREDSTWNIACKTNENGIYGNWSLEVYTPKVFQAVSLLFVNDRSQYDVVGKTEAEQNSTGIAVNMYAHYFGYKLWEYKDGEKQQTQNIYENIDPKDNVGWHILRFERNSKQMSFFLDQQVVLESSLTEQQLPSFELFCLQLGMGDHTRIDNIFITTEGEPQPTRTLLPSSETPSSETGDVVYGTGWALSVTGFAILIIRRFKGRK